MRYTQDQRNKPTIGPSTGWRGEGKFYVGHTYRPQVGCARDLGHRVPDEHDLDILFLCLRMVYYLFIDC